MDYYGMRQATDGDVGRVVEIYNSNRKFLINHLGVETVDGDFIRSEMGKMRDAGFLSCVVTDVRTGDIIGVMDYKSDTTAYLSLMMIDGNLQGKGAGTHIFGMFEAEMVRFGNQAVRIDVVNDYAGNVVSFWEKQGFVPQKETVLRWGNKTSRALVMTKSLT